MAGMLDRVKGWLFEDGEENPVATADPQPAPKKRKPSLLSLHSPRGEEIFIRRPRSRDDAPVCADCLRARCPVVMNLKALDTETALRVFDFLAGVVYAIDGQMEAVGEGIFLLTPREVDITAEAEGNSPLEPEEIAFWQE
ncbi:MAG: cell division protein SepF [Armatimonadetes bacterium]|nr:cell division protein SepF [Armatimonadota bacterium]NIM23336.1 cell division protein SepF [Armatimonadota bacterium]NIM67200.1 cell division protein SepF [Armatimonadota bacterium]NIM75725.1 cell division protein SepF [Armatimonadota bacterium]NIN05389.1 cell division protein SepF [Armatimonadota bacterium]